ncbi:MAG: DNA polymerase III subunit delta [Buchnera aphidicola (Periphyllus acericola)]|uniref:DNA polymerase III subunit delta n=1 Tax=Buchnera aphidicola TaxID=9 RepID=UPI0030CF7E14|nr:DNA polymerase III subunit delta [Buchnera aphidicola (Periphyllus acericola)]
MNIKEIIDKINKKNKFCYIIYGKESFLIEKYKEIILTNLKKKKINKIKIIEINKNKDWKNFFYYSKKKSFLYEKKIIILKINIKNINNEIIKNFKKKYITKINIIIIILKQSNYTNIIKINSKKKFFNKQLLIPCFNFKKYEFFQWIQENINHKIIDMKLKNFLYNKYKNNFLLLNQNLNIISLIFKKKITLKKLKKVLIYDKIYTIFEWINFLLLGNVKKCLLVLKSLNKSKIHPLIIVKHLENKLIILILLKKIKKNKQENFFKKMKIWKSSQKLYIRSIKKNNYSNFLKIIKSLNWIKLSLKKIEEESIWIVLKEISLMFN